MKLYKGWLLQTICTIILVAIAYATSTDTEIKKQAEVNLQQSAAAPSIPLKYGDKTTIKIPNQEVLHLPRVASTNPTQLQTRQQQQVSPNGVHSRIERKDSGLQRIKIVTQHEVPIVHKNSESVNKSITSAVGQQQQHQQQQQQRHQRTSKSNRSNSTKILTQTQRPLQPQPPTSYQADRHAAETKSSIARTTTQSIRQRIPSTTTTTSRTVALPFTNNNRPSLSSRNADVQIYTSNSSTVSHRRNNNNININNPKSETSLNKQRALRPPPFQLNFNIFTPEFWQFLIPNSSQVSRIQTLTTTTTATTPTRRPPKKYKPPTQTTTKEEKLNFAKSKQNIPTRTTNKQTELLINTHDDSKNNNNNANLPKRSEGPFRIAFPTINVISSTGATNDDDGDKDKRNAEGESSLRERFNCPRESEVRFQLFPKICKIDKDCKVWNREEICCEIFGAKSCVSGIPKPLEETSHTPFFGVIPRKCPNRPLAELWWEVKECETDMDCWPRVCCPDGRRRYCRTSQPELSTVPVPVQRSFNFLSEYLECTPPPPPIFDLHPKACTSTLDCFPNVCCQEEGLRHCRPPKKSVLTMLANVFNVGFVKRLTENIVIK